MAGPQAGRLAAIDVTRGLMLVANIASPAWLSAPLWWGHAPWVGVHGSDLIFPVFVTLTGTGLALAYRRGVTWPPTLRRVFVLVLVGLLYNAYHQFLDDGALSLGTLRWSGVLQLYAVLVLVMALVRTAIGRFERWWVWGVLALLVAAAHTGALALAAAGCSGGQLSPECNPSALLDPRWLGGGAHMYGAGLRGHDPEGVVSMAGALVSVLGGAALARLLADSAAREAGAVVARMTLLAAVFGVASVTAASFVPPMKRLWTAPFSLGVLAGVTVVITLAYLAVDRGIAARGSAGQEPRAALVLWPLLALGRNSLLVYFGSMTLTATLRTLPRDGQPIAQVIAEHVQMGSTGPLGFVLASVALWVLIAMLLDRAGIYLRP
ncbi:heparan-alpha-glucosaminide N-acetyltransferase domain-containing protein [Gephyromycinifex aptenodytis]|uniref:heparan-alpha-glucosaminide N-acetyltransferase domain-containing protein n=1 Tax=Gephyromycinifex aptenodytis TaxID=2716227 RepID=UPI001445CF50|nr:heparan-alpha-glucosaminide N-acetyltransferase domain-containing protein [Gephyromycinifex aptenodytis]